MTQATLEWRGYSYYPYEKEFARREVERLFGTPGTVHPIGVQIPVSAFRAGRAEKLTYFARARTPNGEVVVPKQVELEASARITASARQHTRYSSHGLHEYKGKFNPQIVRAIGNIIGLGEGDWVLDPFCGSGTSLLECAHAGWNAIGLDRNPLAVQIASAKLHALRHADRLASQAAKVASELERYGALAGAHEIRPGEIRRILGAGWESELPSFAYLTQWFNVPVLAQIVAARRALRAAIPRDDDRKVFEVILSDHLREVSLQEPQDLRIRRRKDAAPNYAMLARFAASTIDRLDRVQRARSALGDISGHQGAHFGDNREPGVIAALVPRGGVDAVITSPPYETALPYIDTQRLSLVLFGLIDSTQIQSTERQLIGARDISVGERERLEARITGTDDSLPSEIIDVCRELLLAAAAPKNGFRRRNRPALVYRYFKNMEAFFTQLRAAVRVGGKVAVVIGPSRTTLGAKDYVIDTPRLLAALGGKQGFEECLTVEMETYSRYNLHRRNSINSETLVVFTSTRGESPRRRQPRR